MKAIVLCAGYGTRLGNLTRELPKSMLPIAGEPLLGYTLRYLAANGFDDIAINLHHMPEPIIDFVGDGARFGVAVRYSHEKELLGTAGAVKKLERIFAGPEPFLVVYGDLLIDQDLAPMLETHRTTGARVTLLVHKRAGSNSFVRLDASGRLTEFVERPTGSSRAQDDSAWVNSGLYIAQPGIIDRIPADQNVDFPRDLFVPLLEEESFYGFPLTGYRCAIDSPDRYREACAAVEDGLYKQ